MTANKIIGIHDYFISCHYCDFIKERTFCEKRAKQFFLDKKILNSGNFIFAIYKINF